MGNYTQKQLRFHNLFSEQHRLNVRGLGGGAMPGIKEVSGGSGVGNDGLSNYTADRKWLAYRVYRKNGSGGQSNFGWRKDPFTGLQKFHLGIDMTGTTPTADVFSIGPGTVTKAENSGDGYGVTVKIDHGHKITTRYCHLSEVNKENVKLNSKIDENKPIGKQGSTGKSTGPHVHFGVCNYNSDAENTYDDGNTDPLDPATQKIIRSLFAGTGSVSNNLLSTSYNPKTTTGPIYKIAGLSEKDQKAFDASATWSKDQQLKNWAQLVKGNNGLWISLSFDRFIRNEANFLKIDADVLRAILYHESGYRPDARGEKIKDPDNMHYGFQAQGIGQYMPLTFANMYDPFDTSTKNRRKFNPDDPYQAIVMVGQGIRDRLIHKGYDGNYRKAVAAHFTGTTDNPLASEGGKGYSDTILDLAGKSRTWTK